MTVVTAQMDEALAPWQVRVADPSYEFDLTVRWLIEEVDQFTSTQQEIVRLAGEIAHRARTVIEQAELVLAGQPSIEGLGVGPVDDLRAAQTRARVLRLAIIGLTNGLVSEGKLVRF